MCQRVYIASRTLLPPLRRSVAVPHLAISGLSQEAVAVRRWFSKDAKHFGEAYGPSRCGCGFPEMSAYSEHRGVPKDGEESVQALATYLDSRPGGKYIAELLLCWIGDEGQKPSHERDVTLSVLRTPGFRFRRGEILRVHAGE